LLEGIFDEGRGVRKRGDQNVKPSQDKSKQVKVQDVAKTTKVQDVAKKDTGPKLEPKAKPRITEFADVDDWVMSMIMVSLLHANPEMKPEEAMKEGKLIARKLSMPRTEALWRRQIVRITRHGIRAEASKIRREMFKLI
jgi:hypothetical protein